MATKGGDMTGNLKENPQTVREAGASRTAGTAEADYPIAEIHKWLAARFDEGQEATYVCRIKIREGLELLGFLKWDQTYSNIKIPLGWKEKRGEYGLGYMLFPGNLSDKKWEEINKLALANNRFFEGKRNPLDTWPKLGLKNETDYGKLRCRTHKPDEPYGNKYIWLFYRDVYAYDEQVRERAYQLSGLREIDILTMGGQVHKKYYPTVGYWMDAMIGIEFAKKVHEQPEFGWTITPIPLKEE